MAQLSWLGAIAMVLYGFNPLPDAIFAGRFVNDTTLFDMSFAYPPSPFWAE